MTKAGLENDSRVVMTMDAGGTSFRFSAIRGNRQVARPFSVPTDGGHLESCLAAITGGFERIRESLPVAPAAISFSFPGPADYPLGIIGDLGNLPGFRGGVPLGPILENHFGIPVFINNDGDLFTLGESIAGFLPQVNSLLEQSGSPKRYKNLFGITLGTGLGGGIVRNGEIFGGDNICSGEIWLMRHKLQPAMNAEEGACIRAVRRSYAELVGIDFDQAPDPKTIFEIGSGNAPGVKSAAVTAFRDLGEVVGEVAALATTLLDGLTVIGGGVAGAWPLFLPSVIGEMNGSYLNQEGGKLRRLVQTAFNLEDPGQLAAFLRGDRREIPVPGSGRKIAYDPMPRTGVGISRLGTSEAVAIGAYAFALQHLA